MKISDNEMRNRVYFAVFLFYLLLVVIPLKTASASAVGGIGSWLSGTLTPGLLLAAVMSFRTAEKARTDQFNAQEQIALINERAAFAMHKDAFQTNLSYLGSCVLKQEELGWTQHSTALQEKCGGFDYLWLLLDQEIKHPRKDTERANYLLSLKGEKAKPFLQEFQCTLMEFLKIAYDARLLLRIDRRLRYLPGLFTYFELWQIDPIIYLKSEREQFTDYFGKELRPAPKSQTIQ